nr:unnamed protein product [Spirometra erinaceieuropaei]
MFSAMLMDAYRDEGPGICIAYRTDGHLLNQRRMHFQSCVSTTTVHELLFADDCVLNTTSEEETQRSLHLFPAACENFGLVINTQKTVVMHQPPPNIAYPPNAPPQISVNGTQLQVVENFPYLAVPSPVAPKSRVVYHTKGTFKQVNFVKLRDDPVREWPNTQQRVGAMTPASKSRFI